MFKRILIIIIIILGIIFGAIYISFDAKKEDKIRENNKSSENSIYEYLKLEYKDDNIIYSPLSIRTAFSMLKEGAKGETKEELDKLFSGIKNTKYKTSDKLSFANSIFINENFKNEIKKEYVKTLKEKYYSEVLYDKFESPDNINNWIKEKTFGLIEQALDEGSVDSNTALALVNALAIDIKWKQEFNENDTYLDSFYLKDGKISKTLMMHNIYSSKIASYYKNEKIEAVRLDLEPIDGVNLELFAIMPDDIDKYIDELSKKKIDSLSNKLVNASDKTKLKLSFPKFKFDYKLNLIDDLKKLGVNKIFEPTADLTGIGNDLYVSNAVHKSTIDLGEKGVKASATTVIVVTKNSIDDSKYVNIDFNKPFIFIIRDKKKKDVWFVGLVQNLGELEIETIEE